MYMFGMNDENTLNTGLCTADQDASLYRDEGTAYVTNLSAGLRSVGGRPVSPRAAERKTTVSL